MSVQKGQETKNRHKTKIKQKILPSVFRTENRLAEEKHDDFSHSYTLRRTGPLKGCLGQHRRQQSYESYFFQVQFTGYNSQQTLWSSDLCCQDRE